MTERPFTVAVCQAGPCRMRARGTDVMGRLASAVRRCPHGVLVRTGCLLHAARCRSGGGHDSGCYLWVQPCDVHRRPHGVVIPVGPVLNQSDADSVAGWLRDGDLDVGRLDVRLRRAPATWPATGTRCTVTIADPAKTFDAAAPDFAALAPLLWDPLGRELVAHTAPRKGERVLDACCGAGASAIPAARAVGPDGRVDAVDLSARLLDAGRSAAQDLPQLCFQQSDAGTWRPADGPYDLVQSAYGVFFLPDMDAGSARLISLLRPGGRFAVQTWRHGALADFARCMFEAFSTELGRKIAPPAARSAGARIDTPETLAGWLDGLGLTDVQATEIPFTRPLTEDLAWGLVRGTGWRHLLDGCDAATQTRIRDRLVSLLAERDLTELDAGSLVGTGIRP